MEASLQEFKASPRMVPRAVYLPNCDRKGFYKRKQVHAPVPGFTSEVSDWQFQTTPSALHF
jgi:hypothetical protein